MSSSEVVPYTRQPLPLAGRAPGLEVAARIADSIAGTDFVPNQLRNNPAAIAAAILYGDEVGLGPMQSLAKIAVINGRPTLAAEAQRALILAAGHDLWVEETTITRCTVAGRRRDSEATSRVTWTLDDAKRAGLAGKPPWRAYPRQMLMARASAELARAVFPDAIGGLAATEELEDVTEPPAGNGPAPVETKTPTKRKRASVSAPATTPTAPAPTEPEAPPVPGDQPQPEEVPRPTDKTLKKLFALYREHGIDAREDRLAHAQTILGKPVGTSKDLTADEASTLITELENTPARPRPTFAQKAHLTVLFRDRGIMADPERASYMTETLARPVDNVDDLTPAEADQLIGSLTRPDDIPY